MDLLLTPFWKRFHTAGQGSPLKTGGVEYIPKTVRLNFELTVLPNTPLVSEKTASVEITFTDSVGGQRYFPYRTGLRNPGDSGNTTTTPTDPVPAQGQVHQNLFRPQTLRQMLFWQRLKRRYCSPWRRRRFIGDNKWLFFQGMAQEIFLQITTKIIVKFFLMIEASKKHYNMKPLC